MAVHASSRLQPQGVAWNMPDASPEDCRFGGRSMNLFKSKNDLEGQTAQVFWSFLRVGVCIGGLRGEDVVIKGTPCLKQGKGGCGVALSSRIFRIRVLRAERRDDLSGALVAGIGRVA